MGVMSLYPRGLQRFIDAQNRDGVYERAIEELRTGCKRTHWMWFVFPQEAGLSESFMGRRFAIYSLEEAVAYLSHPVLAPRLLVAIMALHGQDPRLVFNSVDARKYESSIEMFTRAAICLV